MIDLTKEIEVAPMLYETSVSPSSAAPNPKFERMDPRLDRVTRLYHSGRYVVLGLDQKCRDIGPLVEKSRDSQRWDVQIEEYNAEAEAYRTLFQEAPRTKLERDKLEAIANVLVLEHTEMLNMLKRAMNELAITKGLDEDDGICSLYSDIKSLIAEMESGTANE